MLTPVREPHYKHTDNKQNIYSLDASMYVFVYR